MEGGGEAEEEDKRAIPVAAADDLQGDTAANAPDIICIGIASTLRCDEHADEMTSLKLFCPMTTELLENIRRTAAFMVGVVNDDIIDFGDELNGPMPVAHATATPNKL